MKMVFILILLLPISLVASTDKTNVKNKGLYTYSYNDKSIYFNQRQYTRYIRPQLESLVESYYSLIKNSHPVQSDILVFKKDFYKQSSAIKNRIKNCFTPAFDCEVEDWRNIHQKTLVLNQIVTNFKIKIDSLDKKNERFLDQYIEFVTHARPMIFQFSSLIEKQTISGKFKDSLAHEFEKCMTYINTNINLLMTSMVDNPKNRIFYSLWNHFINPVEEYLNDRGGKDRLKKTLVDLNVQWNSFHFQIEREHVKMEQKVKRAVKQMHRRWTLVLKVIVG